jgi:DNA polymerase V
MHTLNTKSKKGMKVNLYTSTISAGFPNSANDYAQENIDMNEFLIKHAAATFLVKVKGNSMKESGICDGDILIVDRSLNPSNNSIIVAFLDGEFTVKKLRRIGRNLYLIPENKNYQVLKITRDMDFQIWGVVTFVIKRLA